MFSRFLVSRASGEAKAKESEFQGWSWVLFRASPTLIFQIRGKHDPASRTFRVDNEERDRARDIFTAGFVGAEPIDSKTSPAVLWSSLVEVFRVAFAGLLNCICERVCRAH